MAQKVSEKLKNLDTVNWLKNRFKNKVKDKYILNETELRQQIMMKAVFKSIDRDQSKFLDRSELYDMFIRYGINITKTKLREFFQRIDQDEDDKLNWNDFKQALQNQEALQMFIELMRNIRASSDKKGNGDEMNFIPLSFPNMIQEELIQKLQSDQLNTEQKVKQCKNLLSLDKICFPKDSKRKDDKEDEENDEEDEVNDKEDEKEEAFIKMAKRKNNHQQIVLLKRLQEREQNEQRKQRIRRLSSSQYYIADTENTIHSIRKNSIQDTSCVQQTEFRLIESVIKGNSKIEFPLNNENQKIQSSYMMMSERINFNDSENHFKYNKKKEKQETRTRTSSVPRSSYYTNQYTMNIRTSVKGFEKRLSTPNRVRVISHTEQWRCNTNSLY